MNYLAHLYLSGDDEGLLVGNFIADGMKGTKLKDYPQFIQRGIVLHRKIDHFTDGHPLWRQSKEYLFPRYRHYAGVLVDMFYDYFLSKHWNEFSAVPLEEFAHKCYQVLGKYRGIYSQKSARFLNYIIRENALVNYQFDDKFKITLTHLSSRLENNYCLEESMNELYQHYTQFDEEFLSFFPELITFVNEVLEKEL